MTRTTPQVGDGHHECYPQRLIVKFDGGALPMLCPTCRRIVGYMPDGWASARNPPRPEREVKAEALRQAAAEIASLLPYGAELRHDGSEDRLIAAYADGLRESHTAVTQRADRIARGDA